MKMPRLTKPRPKPAPPTTSPLTPVPPLDNAAGQHARADAPTCAATRTSVYGPVTCTLVKFHPGAHEAGGTGFRWRRSSGDDDQ